MAETRTALAFLSHRFTARRDVFLYAGGLFAGANGRDFRFFGFCRGLQRRYRGAARCQGKQKNQGDQYREQGTINESFHAERLNPVAR
ncbi:MAG TPA: hypothetical protein VI457_13900, partial [Methylococcaceae bacterium]|nr:hypothetical protein [Methylococcaceae bacterium]